MSINLVDQERKKLFQFLFLHGHKLSDNERTMINQSWERGLEKCPQGSQLKYVIEEAYELITDISDVGSHHTSDVDLFLRVGMGQHETPALAYEHRHLLAGVPQLASMP